MAQLKKILLVDDDDDLREALSEQLIMTEDFDVFEAANGADGNGAVEDKVKGEVAELCARFDKVFDDWKEYFAVFQAFAIFDG